MKLVSGKTLILMVFVLCTLSCEDSNDPKPSTIPFLMVGASYTYYLDGIDTIKTVVEKQLAADTFLVRTYSKTVDVLPTQYWVLKDSIFYSSIRLRDPSTYQIVCKFGEPVGTSWPVHKGSELFLYSIEAKNVSINTGEGLVKDAIKIKVSSQSAPPVFQYISPTIGILGNSSVNEKNGLSLIHYTLGQSNITNNIIMPITFGSFPFLEVGKYWNYTEESSILIESKLSTNNIYKIKHEGRGDFYSYWYEDNGILMEYEENENILNADPIYFSKEIAVDGYGWVSSYREGVIAINTITELDILTDSFFGAGLPCMKINVKFNLSNAQSNYYWHENKGTILITGFAPREVIDSNVRTKSIYRFPFYLF
jgi:hypothetical protein